MVLPETGGSLRFRYPAYPIRRSERLYYQTRDDDLESVNDAEGGLQMRDVVHCIAHMERLGRSRAASKTMRWSVSVLNMIWSLHLIAVKR